jgi:hypothetical protein
MGEIPGAREELDRLGRDLRRQVAELAETLTPGADIDLPLFREPAVRDWHEPLGYGYSTVFRGRLPLGVGADGIVSRAAELLRRAGWEVTMPEGGDIGWATDDPGDSVRLAARHPDGNRIEVRADGSGPTVLYDARTPVMALYEPHEFRWPDPVRTPETLTPGHLLCYECYGLGACDCCGGRGWLPSEPHGRSRCSQCAGRHVCPVCRGAGQLAVSQLSPYQRGQYPELDGG